MERVEYRLGVDHLSRRCVQEQHLVYDVVEVVRVAAGTAPGTHTLVVPSGGWTTPSRSGLEGSAGREGEIGCEGGRRA